MKWYGSVERRVVVHMMRYLGEVAVRRYRRKASILPE